MGLDLVDFFRGKHSWRKLRDTLQRLPAHSKFGAARANDPEVAAYVESLPDSAKKYTPPYEDWTPTVASLANIEDHLAHVYALIEAKFTTGRVKQPQQVPRPVTAMDRAKVTARNQRHEALLDEVAQAQARYATST